VTRLAILVLSIALADSLNPSTVAPAFYLATVRHARRRLVEFAAAVFAVNLLAGVVFVVGPGQLALSAAPRPGAAAKHVSELVVGVLLLGFSSVLFLHRDRALRIAPPDWPGNGRSAWALGAAITAVELPTAFPYLGALAAVVASDVSLPSQLVLVALFNLVFVSPVLAIVAAVALAGPGAERSLARLGETLRRNWPLMFAALAAAAGLLFAAFGLWGLGAGH
jgi:cytochrome c biogenesis protein CcdA